MKPIKLQRHINAASEFGQVAVLLGGQSSEREVSLDSGRAVLQSLQQQNVAAIGVDGIADLLQHVHAKRIDRVFNILHGGAGEDGILQGLLAAYQVPVTGSAVLGAALSMDKARSKQIWQDMNLPTADFIMLKNRRAPTTDELQLVQQWMPVIVKPNQQGSTVGIVVVNTMSQLSNALAEAAEYDDTLIIERYIDGDDYTIAFVQQSLFPSVRIRPEQGFYDYHAKYQSDNTQYDVNTLSDAEENELQKLAQQASDAVAVTGWGRVDFMRDQQGRNWLLEVNTVPGMTSHSLVPKAAQAAGYSYDQLIWSILETAMYQPQGQA